MWKTAREAKAKCTLSLAPHPRPTPGGEQWLTPCFQTNTTAYSQPLQISPLPCSSRDVIQKDQSIASFKHPGATKQCFGNNKKKRRAGAQGKRREHQHRTFVEVLQGLEDSPAEGGHGVLHAGAQAEHALQVGLSQELLPVGTELRRAAEQGGHVVHELWHQAGVGVVSLAVVVSDNLAKRKRTQKMHLHQPRVGQVIKSSGFGLVSLMRSGR